MLPATSGNDRGARMMGLPGELWMLPVACIVLGGLLAIGLALGGSHIAAVIFGFGIGGGGFMGCMWAFRGRPPRWARNRLESLWHGAHFESRPTTIGKKHPFK